MIPTRRLVTLLVVPLALAIAGYFVRSVWVAVGALDVVLLVLALVDGLLNRGTVEAERECGLVQGVGRPFEVCVRLANPGARDLALEVDDDCPGEREGLPVTVELASGQRLELHYTLRIDRRGEHRFGAVAVRWTSRLGLWQRQRQLDVPGSVRVYPDFRALRSDGLRAPTGQRRAPVRARRRPGGENEFERLRPYVAGDAYRHIDWKATARRQQFISREYGQESNQSIVFLLDGGRMMTGTTGGLTIFDRALNSALMMGHTALKHGDRVGMMVFDDEIRAWLPPAAGVKNAHRLIRGTYDVFAREVESDYALAFRHLARVQRTRSLVVLLTTMVDDVSAGLADAVVSSLARRHLPVVVWLRDPEVEALLHAPQRVPEDAYVRGAAAELLGWREQALRRFRQRGALTLDAHPDQLTSALIGQYLEVKARRLL